jgi:hypothetical protein
MQSKLFDGQFRVYCGRSLTPDGFVFVVVTVTSPETDTHLSERFIVAPGVIPSREPQTETQSYDTRPFKWSELLAGEDPVEFLFESNRELAERVVDHLAIEHMRSKKIPGAEWPPPYQLVMCAPANIIRAWLRDEQRADILAIRDRTHCGPLVEFIRKLEQLTNVPRA